MGSEMCIRDSLRTKVEAQRDEEMVKEAKEWSEKKGEREALWHDAKGEVEMAVTSVFIGRGRRVKQAVSDYVGAYNSYTQAFLELELRSRAITFYEALKEEIDQLDRKLRSLLAKLNVTKELALASSERAIVGKRVLKGDYVLARSAVDFRGLKQLYERFSPPLKRTNSRSCLSSLVMSWPRNLIGPLWLHWKKRKMRSESDSTTSCGAALKHALVLLTF